MRLMGLENSKAVHLISVCQPDETKITCIGWARNRTGKRATESAKSGTTWESLSLEGLSLGEKSHKPDLPRELTFLEVETALPKLSPLPATGGFGYVGNLSGAKMYADQRAGMTCMSSPRERPWSFSFVPSRPRQPTLWTSCWLGPMTEQYTSASTTHSSLANSSTPSLPRKCQNR